MRSVFASPTVAGLAALVERLDADTEASAVTPNLIPATCTAITPDMLPLVALTQQEIDRIAAQVPGGAANIQDIYPLAPLQTGILFHHMLEGRVIPTCSVMCWASIAARVSTASSARCNA